MFIYLAVSGLSCSMQDLSLWCTEFSLFMALGLSRPSACGIPVFRRSLAVGVQLCFFR